MRTILGTIAAVSFVALSACGDDSATAPTAPPVTTENRPVDIDPDARPAGPLFGGATESARQGGDVEVICPSEGPCYTETTPIDTFVPLPEHQPFCALLDEMSERPYPDDEFEQMVVAQAWFAELRAVTPDEIAEPFDVVIALVDDIVASQTFREPEEGSPAIEAIDTIGAFVDESC